VNNYCQTDPDHSCPGAKQDWAAAKTFPFTRGHRGPPLSVVAMRSRGVLVFYLGRHGAKNARKALADNQPVPYPLTCPACQATMGVNGPDACLGYVPGVRNACCGHGRVCECYVQLDTGVTLRRAQAVDWFRAHGYPLAETACPEAQP
jgi:hypothetical protein